MYEVPINLDTQIKSYQIRMSSNLLFGFLAIHAGNVREPLYMRLSCLNKGRTVQDLFG